MGEAAALSIALAVVALPGVGFLLALDVRRWFWIAAIGPAATIGLAALLGDACAVVGVRFGWQAMAVVTAVLWLLGAFRWWRGRRWSEGRRPARSGVPVKLLGSLMALGGVGLGVRTWLFALNSLGTVPQESDTITHTALVAYIMRSGHGAAWQLMPVDLSTGLQVQVYPAGLHLLGAVTGELVGGPIAGLNAVCVVLLGAWFSVSVAALSYHALVTARVGAGLAMVGSGIAAIVAAGLYRPMFALADQGGALPNAAAFALAPGAVAVLLALRRRERSPAFAAGIGVAGLVTVHPSALVTIGITLVCWWAGECLVRREVRTLARQALPLLLAAVTALVAVSPLLYQLVGAGAAGSTTSFAADSTGHSFAAAVRTALELRYGGFDPDIAGRPQWVPVALTGLGIVAAVVSRRALGPVLAWLVWLAVVVVHLVSPGHGPTAIVAGFFYNSLMRVWSNLYLLVPVLAAIGVVFTAQLLVRALALLPRTGTLAVRRHGAVLLVTAVGLLYGLSPGRGYAALNVTNLASRYGKQDLDRITADDRAGFDYLARHVRQGERVMNSANDGSTYLYVEKDIPVVNYYTLGTKAAPYTYGLLRSFDRYPHDARVRRWLAGLDVRWVYVDRRAPPIGASGAPDHWAGPGKFTLAPGLRRLDGLPGLREVFTSGTVHVYHLDPAAVVARPR